MKPATHISLNTSLTALEGRVGRIGVWTGFGLSPSARGRRQERWRVCRDICYALRGSTNTAKLVSTGPQATGYLSVRDQLCERDRKCLA